MIASRSDVVHECLSASAQIAWMAKLSCPLTSEGATQRDGCRTKRGTFARLADSHWTRNLSVSRWLPTIHNGFRLLLDGSMSSLQFWTGFGPLELELRRDWCVKVWCLKDSKLRDIRFSCVLTKILINRFKKMRVISFWLGNVTTKINFDFQLSFNFLACIGCACVDGNLIPKSQSRTVK